MNESYFDLLPMTYGWMTSQLPSSQEAVGSW
jgi:hypothetical protein